MPFSVAVCRWLRDRATRRGSLSLAARPCNSVCFTVLAFQNGFSGKRCSAMQDLQPKLLALGIVMVLFALGFLPERDERRGVSLGDVLLDESVRRNSAAPEADENDRQMRVRYAA